jgi:hypothetical protein
MTQPSFLQAVSQQNPRTGMPVSPLTNPALTKGAKLLAMLGQGVQGALAGQAASEAAIAASGGRRAGGVGTGFEAGVTLPFLRAQQQQQVAKGAAETSVAQQQAQYFPQTQLLGILKSQSDINKNNAEANKNTAEAGAVPSKVALEQAQKEAAFYKDDPNLGLVDLRSGQPVNSAGFAPLSPEEAVILGKQPGEQVPLKLKNTANEMVNRGIRSVNAGGRSLLVDSKGNTIKDLGAASNVVSFNLQNQGLNGQNGQPSALAQAVAKGDMKWSDVISPRTPQSVKESFAQEVKALNPAFNSGDFGVEQKVREKFTSGNVSDQLMAIGTAREHMKTFGQLADALNNSNWQLANKLGNAFGVEFGSDKATNLRIAAQAFGGEVGRAFDGAGVTAGERQKAESAYADYLSKGQFKGAINIVDELLAGKQRSAKQAYDAGRAGQPNFGSGGSQGNRPPLSSFEKK